MTYVGPISPKDQKQNLAHLILDQRDKSVRLQSEITAAKAENEALRGRVEELESVPQGWCDVRIHGLPEEACELWFVIQTPPSRVVHGAFIDGVFWHNNKKYVALFYMPKPCRPDLLPNYTQANNSKEAWLLRKQAEAVEAITRDLRSDSPTGKSAGRMITSLVLRSEYLRKQADETERQENGCRT